VSIKLMSLVWDLDLAAGEKLVLLALADQANDEGVQCWPSVATIGKRSGQGERTVRRILRQLEDAGHITSLPRSGTSSQYHVHPGQIGTPAKLAPRPKTTDTPAKLAPKTPRTIKTKNTQDAREHELPENWEPVPFGEGSECRKIIDGWPPGELEIQIEHFRALHEAKGDKFKNWQAAWKTWALNSRKFTRHVESRRPSRREGENRTRNAAQRVAERLGISGNGDQNEAGAAAPRLDAGGASGLPLALLSSGNG
jgi:hypothetical protein